MKKYIAIVLILFFSLSACKECVECSYSSLKGTQTEKFCSSTKQDRIDFEKRMEEEAADNSSKAICTKEKY